MGGFKGLPDGIAGFHSLATGQVDFTERPPELVKHLPRRVLPVAVLAWLGVDHRHRGQGLGDNLLAQALRDCWDAGRTFPFIAILIDCKNPSAKTF